MNNTKNYILAEADYMSGMKYKEIAAKYGVTINTVKSWKTRYKWSKKQKKVCIQNKKVCTQKEAIAPEVEQVIDNPDLTDKQRLFCLHYVRCFNATKAYQKAYGCSYETALTNGSAILRNTRIKKEILKLKQNRLNREFLSQEDIFQKYMDIAFSDITDYVKFGTEEVPVMAVYGPVQIEDEETGEKKTLTQTVNTVLFRESEKVDGTIISEVKQGRDGASLKLLDKMKALQWLSDHMDMGTQEQRERIELLKLQQEKLKLDTNNGEYDDGVEIINDAPKEEG